MTAPSASATFVVDKKVNLTVAQLGSTATQVTAGATSQVTTFTVTNLTNATEDFRLVGDQPLLVPTNYGVQNFTVSNIRTFVDSNNNGVYDAGDTQTFVNALAPDSNSTVFVVADIPSTAGASTSYVSLLAVAADVGAGGALGADIVATSTLAADSPTTVDVVFADGASLNDAARNGQARAYDAYQITTAAGVADQDRDGGLRSGQRRDRTKGDPGRRGQLLHDRQQCRPRDRDQRRRHRRAADHRYLQCRIAARRRRWRRRRLRPWWVGDRGHVRRHHGARDDADGAAQRAARRDLHGDDQLT